MTLLADRPRVTRHPLRPELRRGFAPLAGGAVLLTLLVALAVPAETWQGGWAETRDRTHTAAVLLGFPLAVAAGCWQGGRERRRRTGELLETAVRGPLPRFLASALPVALWVAAGHLAAAALALLATWYCATGDSPYVLVPLADTLVLGCAALAGQVGGRVLPWRLTAPLLATAAYVLLGTLSYDSRSTLAPLSPLLDTAAHQVPVWWQPMVTVAWVGGLTTAAVLALTARRRATALVPLTAATAAAVLLVHTGDDGLVRTNPIALRQVCDTSTTPQICVNARYEKLLPQVTEALSGLTGRLEGVRNVPVRFVDVPGRTGEDEVRLPMITPLGRSVAGGELTDPQRYAWEAGMMLVGRSWCDRTDPATSRVDDAVEHYLAPKPMRDDFDELDPEIDAKKRARARLLAMADEDRRTWLSEYFLTADVCDPKAVPEL
ncbi:hypothetical protein [Streptomyces sp. NPDC126514]|uniref:hypothetical protein n=1 Tax=Streptomyces sp. NPDC126514 TaxID=3155210 RepID=UPI00332BC2F6